MFKEVSWVTFSIKQIQLPAFYGENINEKLDNQVQFSKID